MITGLFEVIAISCATSWVILILRLITNHFPRFTSDPNGLGSCLYHNSARTQAQESPDREETNELHQVETVSRGTTTRFLNSKISPNKFDVLVKLKSAHCIGCYRPQRDNRTAQKRNVLRIWRTGDLDIAFKLTKCAGT